MPAFSLQQPSVEAEPGAGNNGRHIHIIPRLAEHIHAEPVHAVPLGDQVVIGIEGKPVPHDQPGPMGEAVVEGRQEAPIGHIVRIENHQMGKRTSEPLLDEGDPPAEHGAFPSTGAVAPFQYRHMGVLPSCFRRPVRTVVRQDEHLIPVSIVILVLQALEKFPDHRFFVMGTDQDGKTAGAGHKGPRLLVGQPTHEHSAAGPEEGQEQHQLDNEGQYIHHDVSLRRPSG